jgi:hypothetical protein
MKRILSAVFASLVLSAAFVVAQTDLTNADVIKLSKAGMTDDFIINLVNNQPSRLIGGTDRLVDLKTKGVSERVIGVIARKAPSGEALNSDSIMALARAGFSDEFLIDIVRAEKGQFSADTSRILALKQAGVSERVISAMMEKSGGAAGYGSATGLRPGTEVTIRLIDNIDSEKNDPGSTFRASVEDAIVEDGREIVPRGADALVKLAAEKDSGKLSGKTELTLQLVSVTVNGRPYLINSTNYVQASKSRTGRTVKSAAAVGAIGAIIGGIAGGGKGAAIGAGAGAAAGAGSQVFMKGQRVKIPSETELTFTVR